MLHRPRAARATRPPAPLAAVALHFGAVPFLLVVVAPSVRLLPRLLVRKSIVLVLHNLACKKSVLEIQAVRALPPHHLRAERALAGARVVGSGTPPPPPCRRRVHARHAQGVISEV